MKKNLILIISIAILIAVILLFFPFTYPARYSANPDYATLSEVRGVRVDYLHLSTSRREAARLATQMQAAGVNMVAVGAGRLDWTYFPWAGHSDRWSADVRGTGIDFLLDDSLRFGSRAHISAVVDVLAPLYIKTHPQAASISWTGLPSKNLIATMELVDGSFGQDLLAMIDEIAKDYPVNSITLTELIYYVDGFGPQDEAAYLAYSGQSDWPRTLDGQINIDDASIGTWRAFEIGRFLEKAAAVVHRYGKQLFFEVRVGVNASGQIEVTNGTDMGLFLKYADRLVVWGNRELDSDPGAALQMVATYVAGFDPERTILELGLWADDDPVETPHDQMTAISSADFETELQAAGLGGVQDLLITPSFLMNAADWSAISNRWSGK